MKQTTKILQGVPPRSSFFSMSRSLQNQGQLLLVLQKNKALPEGSRQLNSQNDTDQDQVLIRRRNGYPTQ